MSDRPGSEQPAAGPARLTSRPALRPPEDPRQRTVFGRPTGTPGSFAPGSARGVDSRVGLAAPTDPGLAQAFGRPDGTAGSLQRDPAERSGARPTGGATPPDPWRDPGAGAVLGAPALSAEAGAVAAPVHRLGVREVLLGSRVRPRALVTLGALALVIGLLGGLLVLAGTRASNPLTDPTVTLAQVPGSGAGTDLGGVAAVAAAVLPAVVSVESRNGDSGGTGSGVVIDGRGFIVTNNHVISQAANDPQGTTLSVVFGDGTRAGARIVGRDTKTDLAVLRVEVSNPTVAELGRSADLAVGDQVVAVGSPLGLVGTVTTGIVSAVDRPVRLAGDGTDTNAVIDAVQTDAAINPGNSGGPLVDLQGRIVAINSAIRTSGADSTGSIGLGFAIPVDEVAQVTEEIIRTGRATHPDLGVNARSVVDGDVVGAQVANVQDGSAAAAAGLVEGDVITRVGERGIDSADELAVAVMEQQIGTAVTLQVVRGGRRVDVEVTLQSD